MERKQEVGEEAILREASPEEMLEKSGNSESDGEHDLDDCPSDAPFTKRMKDATRNIHRISDALVNAKLGLALSDENVWAEGILVFSDIFFFLEEAVKRLSDRNAIFNRIFMDLGGLLERTDAFKQDLDYYYSPERDVNYTRRPAVQEYLKHLQTLEEREPIRLFAYVYHLYMGLLSGGQILLKKKKLGHSVNSTLSNMVEAIDVGRILSFMLPGLYQYQPQDEVRVIVSSDAEPGNAVVTFSVEETGRNIRGWKEALRRTIDTIALDLSKDERDSILEESLEVFRRNNQIVKSIQSADIAVFKKVFVGAIVAVGAVGTLWYLGLPYHT